MQFDDDFAIRLPGEQAQLRKEFCVESLSAA